MLKGLFNWFKNNFQDTWLGEVVKKLFFSLENGTYGLSGKKITIVVLVYCVVNMHQYWLFYALKYRDFSLLPIVLGSDLTTILSLFGINQYDKFKTRKLEQGFVGADLSQNNQQPGDTAAPQTN